LPVEGNLQSHGGFGGFHPSTSGSDYTPSSFLGQLTGLFFFNFLLLILYF